MLEVWISGQARLATLVSDDALLCLAAGREIPEARNLLEYDYLFASIGDLRVERCKDWTDVSSKLQTAVRQDDALILFLILLDGDADNEARREAVPLLEEFLAYPEVELFLLRRLTVAPLPGSADLAGSIARARSADAPALVGLVELVSDLRLAVERVCSAWEALPVDLFVSLPERASLKRSLRDLGVFHFLALDNLQAALEALNDWPANQRPIVTTLIQQWYLLRYPAVGEGAYPVRTGFLTENLYLEDEIRGELNFEEIVGNSPSLRRVLKQVEIVAPTDLSVIIYGETGTGKELIARAIHDLSARRSGTFVNLNCAAMPTGLLESELFGHEKGAFTGALSPRIGRFELAKRGTILLDEIAEIPLELQPKLLRVLQEREFERLGGSRTLRFDARLVAATNRDLSAMVDKRAFRADLFYRLNVFSIHVPPLRERPEDIPLLVRHFVQQYARRMNRNIDTIPTDSMTALKRYPWPGNVRELRNVIERAVILSSGPVLQVHVEELKGRTSPTPDNEHSTTLADAERNHILAVLKQTDWVLAGAAARLGTNRSTLIFRMKKLGIELPAWPS